MSVVRRCVAWFRRRRRLTSIRRADWFGGGWDRGDDEPRGTPRQAGMTFWEQRARRRGYRIPPRSPR